MRSDQPGGDTSTNDERANIELFGPIAVTRGSVRVEPSGRSAQILALLAVRRGTPISAERLLDLLWPEAPSSGLNALQRHLSSLRRLLRDAGLDDVATSLVRHHNGAYRLDPTAATTDLDLLDAPSAGASAGPGPTLTGDAPAPRWWLEPLMGLPYETFAQIRVSLDLAALGAARRWLAGDWSTLDPRLIIDSLTGLAHRHPNDELVWTALREALRRDAGGTAPATQRRPAGFSELDHLDARSSRFAGLSAPVARWLGGDTAGALTLLDEAESSDDGSLDDNLRRARRWLSTLDPADGNVRILLGDMVARSRNSAHHAERALVSLDAYTLARHDTGRETAEKELAGARSHDDRLRAQRVLTFLLMGSPLSDGFGEAVEALGAIDDAEARAEAARFRVTVRLRQGRFDGIVDELDRVHDQLASLGPDHDWYRHCGRCVLHYHPPTRPLVPELDHLDSFHERALEQYIVDSALLWHALEHDGITHSTTSVLRRVVNEVSIPGAHAYEALHLLAVGRVNEAADRLRPYRGTLAAQPRDTFAHLLPVAAARVAEALRDDHLAAEVVATLEPWAGEYLGGWPFDLLIEPVDELLDRLR